MKYYIAALLAAPIICNATICEWSNPGANRYTGDTVAAIWRYKEIPLLARAALVLDVTFHNYKDQVTITKDRIEGGFRYAPTIVRMNFNNGRICDAITRKTWSENEQQGALIYIVGKWRVGVAAVCGNTFLVTPPVASPGLAYPGPYGSPVPLIRERSSVVHTVPEPSSLWLSLLGFIAIYITKKGGKNG